MTRQRDWEVFLASAVYTFTECTTSFSVLGWWVCMDAWSMEVWCADFVRTGDTRGRSVQH